MIYREFRPLPELARYVKCIWTLEGKAEGASEPEKILPDGCMELLFHYGDRFRCRRSETMESQPGSFLFGQITHSIELMPGDRIGIVAVRFHPHGLQPFLCVPLHELRDTWTPSDDLLGRDWRELEGRLLEAEENAARVAMLQRFLLGRLLGNRRHDYLTEECVARILRSNGKISIDALTRGHRVSYRHMERRFKESVGIGPKLLARIVRFQNLLRMTGRSSAPNFAALAHDAGYYDQSHLVRDFKAFAGETPGSYFAGRHTLSDSLIDGERSSSPLASQ